MPVVGDYPRLDQWRLLEGEDITAKLFRPHNTPRPTLQPFALDYVYARLDLPGQRVTFLADWMRRRAPQPYRQLWAELHPTT